MSKQHEIIAMVLDKHMTLSEVTMAALESLGESLDKEASDVVTEAKLHLSNYMKAMEKMETMGQQVIDEQASKN